MRRPPHHLALARPLRLLVLALLLPACDREFIDHDGVAQADLSGSVRVPLSTTTDDGTTYVLRTATIELSGSAMLTLTTNQAGPKQGTQDPARERSEPRARAATRQPVGDALAARLPAGSYSLFLRPDFQLVELDPAGGERPVDARVTGPNPSHFKLREVEDATLKLTFERAGQTIVFGAPSSLRITSAR